MLFIPSLLQCKHMGCSREHLNLRRRHPWQEGTSFSAVLSALAGIPTVTLTGSPSLSVVEAPSMAVEAGGRSSW